MRYYSAEFWRAARLLKTQFPLSAPIRITTVPSATLLKAHGEPCYGDYLVKESASNVTCYVIRIARNMSLGSAIDALLHEYGHCIDMDRNPRNPREYHGKSWGSAYSECYRAVIG